MINSIPSAVPSLHRAITESKPDAAVTRIATVADIAATSLGIRVGSSTVVTRAGWVQSYRPVLGDNVAVTRQGATWTVLGALGSTLSDSTLAPNYNFTLGATNVAPPNWQLVTAAGSPTLTTVAWSDDDLFDGPNAGRLRSTTTATVTTDVVSDPILATPGEQWVGGGWVRTSTDFTPGTVCSVQVAIAWYGDVTLGSFLSQTASRAQPVVRGMDWTLLRVQGGSGITAVAGATRARVKFLVSWSATANDAIYFNRVIARRL